MATKRHSLKQHHIMGAGAIASIMGVLHFLSQSGLTSAALNGNLGDIASTYQETVGAFGTVSSGRSLGFSPNTTTPFGSYPNTSTSGSSSPYFTPQSHSQYLPHNASPAGYPTQAYPPSTQGYNTHPYNAQGMSPPVGYNHAGYNTGYNSAGQTAGYNPWNSGGPAQHPNMQAGQIPTASAMQNNAGGDIKAYFSPMGGCTDAIVHEIRSAQRQVLIQAYTFTSEPIATACIAAHARGVAVTVLLDKSQETEPYSVADQLHSQGVQVYIDSEHTIAHNKVILIDGRIVITGSFNFSQNAERSNAENLLVIRDRPDLYQPYENNLKHHFGHSVRYQGRNAVGSRSLYQPGRW